MYGYNAVLGPDEETASPLCSWLILMSMVMMLGVHGRR